MFFFSFFLDLLNKTRVFHNFQVILLRLISKSEIAPSIQNACQSKHVLKHSKWQLSVKNVTHTQKVRPKRTDAQN